MKRLKQTITLTLVTAMMLGMLGCGTNNSQTTSASVEASVSENTALSDNNVLTDDEVQGEKKLTPEEQKAATLELTNAVRERLSKVAGVDLKLSNEDREKMFDDLIAGINDGTIDDKEAYMDLRHIVASIQCGHLSIYFMEMNPYKQYYLPMCFEYAKEGLVLYYTSDKYKEYLGRVVTKINGFTPEEMAERYSQIYPCETKTGAMRSICCRNWWDCELEYTGIMNQGDLKLTLTLAKDDNTTEDVEVMLYDKDATVDEEGHHMMENMPAGVDIPLRYKLLYENGDKNYYSYADKDNGMMYFAYLSCAEMKEQRFCDFFEEMMDTMQADDTTYETLIIDVSRNGGGNRNILMTQFFKYEDYLKNKNIVLITSGNTFSAANQAIEDSFKLFEHVRVYGETPGQAIENYTEIHDYELPGGMGLTVPTLKDSLPRLEERYEDIHDGVKPDVEIRQSVEDYFNGVDTIYERIVKDMTTVSICE